MEAPQIGEWNRPQLSLRGSKDGPARLRLRLASGLWLTVRVKGRHTKLLLFLNTILCRDLVKERTEQDAGWQWDEEIALNFYLEKKTVKTYIRQIAKLIATEARKTNVETPPLILTGETRCEFRLVRPLVICKSSKPNAGSSGG